MLNLISTLGQSCQPSPRPSNFFLGKGNAFNAIFPNMCRRFESRWRQPLIAYFCQSSLGKHSVCTKLFLGKRYSHFVIKAIYCLWYDRIKGSISVWFDVISRITPLYSLSDNKYVLHHTGSSSFKQLSVLLFKLSHAVLQEWTQLSLWVFWNS